MHGKASPHRKRQRKSHPSIRIPVPIFNVTVPRFHQPCAAQSATADHGQAILSVAHRRSRHSTSVAIGRRALARHIRKIHPYLQRQTIAIASTLPRWTRLSRHRADTAHIAPSHKTACDACNVPDNRQRASPAPASDRYPLQWRLRQPEISVCACASAAWPIAPRRSASHHTPGSVETKFAPRQKSLTAASRCGHPSASAAFIAGGFSHSTAFHGAGQQRIVRCMRIRWRRNKKHIDLSDRKHRA